MALLTAMIKTLMAALLVLAASALPGHAASFSMKRGLNLDQWTTWPGEDKWGDRQAILPYPEWRKFLNDDDLKALKSAGFDFLRMPVDPSPFLSDQTPALRDDLYASVLDSVRMINRAGLKVIVDMHLIPGRRQPQDRHGRGDGRSRKPSTPMSRWCAGWRARWPPRIRAKSPSS